MSYEFLYTAKVLLIKLIFNIKKKTADLKLQYRISRNNSSIISYNSDIAFSNIHRKTPVLKCLFNKVAGLRPAALSKRDSSTSVFP